jgi:FXSXX-COOH protein
VDGDASTADADTDWQSIMVDVSGMSLTELADVREDSVLAHCLRRLADDLTRPGEPIAGFNSAF